MSKDGWRCFYDSEKKARVSFLIFQFHVDKKSNVEAVETAIEGLKVPVSNAAAPSYGKWPALI